MESSAATLTEEKGIGRSASPTPVGSINKEKLDTEGSLTEKEENGSVRDAAATGEEAAVEEEFPTGLRLFFIIVALVLSIFLVSSMCPWRWLS
jgi:hypothetical protein